MGSQRSKSNQSKNIAPPKGTRDLYPEDALRRRYITQSWRNAAIRCGFDEIEGPTLESSDLYSIKSGEGILSELFQVYSGKSDSEIEQVQQTGRAPYAMRPEFTPTLARMYAAHAKQLPKPCKWFTAGPYFRAERPQRGRLREFLQWNVDAVGLESTQLELELTQACILLFESFGLSHKQVSLRVNNRDFVEQSLIAIGVPQSSVLDMLAFLDSATKMDSKELIALGSLKAEEHGFDLDAFRELTKLLSKASDSRSGNLSEQLDFLHEELPWLSGSVTDASNNEIAIKAVGVLAKLAIESRQIGLYEWLAFDYNIVRGLAYYTGTVFEAIAHGERAVAGGGRYDNLIELMGGPPTPAVGFAMGDVVLANLLDDNNLMPSGSELMDAVSRPPASVRPDAFVVPNGDEDNEPLAPQLAALLRRGTESEQWLSREDRKPWHRDRYDLQPLHARTTYKSTRNLKKLRADAEKQHARFFVEIHGPDKVELTDMDKREALTSDVGSFNTDPASPHFVGRAIQRATS